MVDIHFAVFNARTLQSMALIRWRRSFWGIVCHGWRNNAKSSDLEDGFLCLLSFIFCESSGQRFSIRFISGNWLSHQSLLITFWLNQYCVTLAAPFSIKRELTWFILPFQNISWSPSYNIKTCLAKLMLPLPGLSNHSSNCTPYPRNPHVSALSAVF